MAYAKFYRVLNFRLESARPMSYVPAIFSKRYRMGGEELHTLTAKSEVWSEDAIYFSIILFLSVIVFVVLYILLRPIFRKLPITMAGRRNQNFEYDSAGRPIAYTDGSCIRNGQPGAAAGYGVHFGENNPYNTSGIIEGRATNNRAEIGAATNAVLQAKAAGHQDLRIRTDSTLLVKGMNEWSDTWKQNGWRNSENKEVINKQDFQQLERASRGMNVVYEHVPGHAGNPGNEAAHRLATDAAENARRY